MDLDKLYLKVLAIGPPFNFFTELSPGLKIDLEDLEAYKQRWLVREDLPAEGWQRSRTRILFTEATFTTDNVRLATGLLIQPDIKPGAWAEPLKVPEPKLTPEPEPKPKAEPKPKPEVKPKPAKVVDKPKAEPKPWTYTPEPAPEPKPEPKPWESKEPKPWEKGR